MSIKPIERKVVVPPLMSSPDKGPSPEMSQLHDAVVKLAEAHNYNDDQLNRALRGGISAANNDNMRLVTVSVLMPSDAPWHPLTLLNSFAAPTVLVPAVLMEPGGHVSIRGDTDTGIAGTQIAQLAAGYYNPNASLRFGFVGNGAFASMLIDTAGAIFLFGAATWRLDADYIVPSAAAPHAFPAPWPLVVQHGFQRCLGLTVEACREVTQNARSTCGAPIVDWEDVGDGSLKIHGVWGLCWGKRYNLRLRLSAEAED